MNKARGFRVFVANWKEKMSTRAPSRSRGGGSFRSNSKSSILSRIFRCWNEQRYYEAHDVLEQLWLSTNTADDNFSRDLIQAAGAFVHLQKNFEHPTHAKHSRACHRPLVCFGSRTKELSIFAPQHINWMWPGSANSCGRTPTRYRRLPITKPIRGRPRARRVWSCHRVKINLAPAITRTVASNNEIARTGNRLLPRCEPSVLQLSRRLREQDRAMGLSVAP